jgi:hypothetical protein
MLDFLLGLSGLDVTQHRDIPAFRYLLLFQRRIPGHHH